MIFGGNEPDGASTDRRRSHQRRLRLNVERGRRALLRRLGVGCTREGGLLGQRPLHSMWLEP
ncbi:MAG: hypothetical protein C0428_13200 [Polaromonas sp.]|nr:hypothetical protein [Polaromonas sp.]